jgi:hypothetical protein
MSKPFCKDPNLTQNRPPILETSAKNCPKQTQRTMAKQQQHASSTHAPMSHPFGKKEFWLLLAISSLPVNKFPPLA